MSLKFFLIIFILTNFLVACQPTDPPPIDDEFTGPLPDAEDQVCPNIDSDLNRLLTAEHPLAAAEEMDLQIQNGKIEVMLTLASGDTDIPTGFDLVVSIRSGDQAQVFVKIDQLCDLASTAEVVYIRVPDIGVPE